MLPKKYDSISNVRVKDVIEAFPLALTDQNYHYVLRIETQLQISQNKRITTWMDINPNTIDVSLPPNRDKIRIKALRLPNNTSLK